MRIRSTKPEFWRSKTIAALPWDVRLVLKGLESYVDDNGVGKDDIALIAADVFPRDLSANPPETLARLSEAISILSQGDLVTRYECDGDELIYVERWKELQRIDKPTKGRFPRPDGTMNYSDTVNREGYRNVREDFGNPPEKVAPGTGEQGNRGTGEKQSPSPASPSRPTYPAAFEEWWQHYPRKTGKGEALKAWERARRKVGDTALLDGVLRFSHDPNLPDAEFIPHAATWLNGGRWDDDPLPARKSSARLTAREEAQIGWDQMRPHPTNQHALGA